MMTDIANFSVPEEISARLRLEGQMIADQAEKENFRCLGWTFKENLSSDSEIVVSFMAAQSLNKEIFFINLDASDATRSRDVFTDDFSIPFSYENFRQVFENSVFAARRIICGTKGRILVASYKDWGVLTQ